MELSLSFLQQALPLSSVSFANTHIDTIQKISPNTIFEFLDSQTECEISIDSRDIKPGSVFIALAGSQTNGHNFVAQAVANGARALIIEDSHADCLSTIPAKLLEKVIVIKVRDTMQALFDMAKHWRMRFTYPIVAITGSVGKTTTKEMVRSILHKANIPAYVSHKNQNSVTGLPMNILNLNHTYKVGVFELGAHKLGDIALFADILRPTTALITGLAHSHAAHLGSIKEIASQKRQVFKNFSANDIGMVCGDIPLLASTYYSFPIIKFGLKVKNQIQARKIKMEQTEQGEFITTFLLRVYGEEGTVTLHSFNMARVYNALGAAAIAHFLKVPFNAIIEGLEDFTGVDGRFVIKKMKDDRGLLVDDCYNASPEAIRAALLAFQEMKTEGLKIAVLGEMREQGEKESFWHRQVGRMLAGAMSIDTVILVGKAAQEIAKTAPISMKTIWVPNWQEAVGVLEKLLISNNALVLVKGSRGVRLENLINEFV